MKRSASEASKHAAADGEAALYQRIRELVVAARQTVVRGIDLVQVRTNYEIGRRIVEQEQHGKDRAAYGKEILIALAERLTQEFGNGYSRSNLEYMRRFFLQYKDRLPISQTASGKSLDAEKSQTVSGQLGHREDAAFQIVQTLSGQSSRPFSLSWSHYVFLLAIKNPDERRFYEIEAADQGWTLRELKRQFVSQIPFASQLSFALSLSKGLRAMPFGRSTSSRFRANGIDLVGLPKLKTTLTKHL